MNRWLAARQQAYRIKQAYTDLYADELLQTIIEDENINLSKRPKFDSLLGGKEGVYCDAIYEPEYKLICINKEMPREKYVFILAHEIGHHFLHTRFDICKEEDIEDGRLMSTVAYAHGRVATYNPYMLQEIEANAFAIELLVPSEQIIEMFDDGFSIEDMVRYFQVSRHTIISQLTNTVLEPPIDFSSLSKEQERSSFSWVDVDDSQEKAAFAVDAPVIVDAGPGTGKTRTLASRIGWLVEKQGNPSDTIIALTFSNKATEELRQRVSSMSLPHAHHVTISTFHGFGLEMVRRYGYLLGVSKDATVLDPIEAENILLSKIAELSLDHFANLNKPNDPFDKIVDFISQLKQNFVTVEDFEVYLETQSGSIDEKTLEIYREVFQVYREYEVLKDSHNLLDYDDLLLLTIKLFEEHPSELDDFRAKHKHVLVDEYQDINQVNRRLLTLLAPEGRGLWVVGDLRQSIYGWRGALPKYFQDFGYDFPEGKATRFQLVTNYRSSEQIVDYLNKCSHQLKLHHTDAKPWRSERGKIDFSQVNMFTASNPQSEVQGIVQTIKSLVEDGGYSFKDFAILCRTHKVAAEFAQGLTENSIPVLHFGDFFQQPEIKILLAVLDLAVNPSSLGWIRLSQALELPLTKQQAVEIWHSARSDQSNISSVLHLASHSDMLSAAHRDEIEHIKEVLSRYQYPAQSNPWLILVDFLFSHGTYLRRLRKDLAHNWSKLLAIAHLLRIARVFSKRSTLLENQDRTEAFLAYIRDLIYRENRHVNISVIDERVNAVSVLTVHTAKGLEFPVVFVPRVAKRTWPPPGRHKAITPPSDLIKDEFGPKQKEKEEKHCMFVALSRARDLLYISRPKKQNGRNRNPSDLWKLIETKDVAQDEWSIDIDDPTATDTHPVEIFDIDTFKLTPSSLRTYHYCPRQFYYRHVLNLHQYVAGEVYLQFHSAITSTIKKLQASIVQGEIPDINTANEFFTGKLSETMDMDKSYASWYLEQGKQLLDNFLRDIKMRLKSGDVKFNITVRQEINGQLVETRIDERWETADALHLIRYRYGKGKKPSSRYGNINTALYLLAGSGEQKKPLIVSIYSLLDGKIIEANTKADKKYLEKELSSHIADIRAGEFSPNPNNRMCAKCTYLLICPM